MKALLPTVAALLFPVPSHAATLGNIACEGPGWKLELWPPNARFTYPSPIDMEIMHDVEAEGAPWPRALTLIGLSDTAIVVLDAAESGVPARALVLTQRAGRPILLEGACAGESK